MLEARDTEYLLNESINGNKRGFGIEANHRQSSKNKPNISWEFRKSLDSMEISS